MEKCGYPTYDFCVWRGEDKELFLAFSIMEKDGTRHPAELDNCKFEMILSAHCSRKILGKLTSENGGIVPGVLEDGVFHPKSTGATVLQILISRSMTSEMKADDFLYELFKEKQDGLREMVLAGVIRVHGCGVLHV